MPKTLAETIELVKQRQATSEEQLKKWVFLIYLGIFLTEHINFKCSLESKLQIESISLVGILLGFKDTDVLMELFRLRAALDEAQKSFQAESKTMKELQEKAKQIEEALA